MKYKGIIFDLDGVICFTDKYHYLAWKKVADKIGAYFDEEINNRLRGVSRMESLEIILERYNGTLTDEQKVALATEKNEYYRDSLKNITPADLNPDTLKALQTLKADGHLLQAKILHIF
ncbi:MAG: HAD hydrolase-like protein [Oscillospiraceae bacterium]